jgi:site-specific DNA recombinase
MDQDINSTLILLTLGAESAMLPIWAVAPKYREEIAMLEQGTRAVGYVRVSTLEQVEHGNGLEVQEEAIRAYCEQRGFELVRIYREEGVSGANGIDCRVALPQLVAALDEGQFEVVVIARLDRLARDLMVQETIIADLHKRGGLLVSVAEPDLCGDDPARELLRQILGGIAQYERRIIAARLMSGRKRKKSQGGFMGGWLPFGYRVEGRRQRASVVVVPEQAAIVQRIFDEYEAGRSMRQIARGLRRDGVKTGRGGSWQAETVGKILRNTAYVDGQYPPIIDRVQWEACTSRRRSYFKRNREQSVA